jgi:2-keto-3-deoxy-L-rhamnonate aldolase RhmA
VKSAEILRRKIQNNELILGAIATMHFWPGLVEITRAAGLDYLIIDAEHTAWDEEQVTAACAIGRMVDFPVLIRPSETRGRLVRMAADKGVCGLLLPFVESAAVLDEVRDALYMPPRGRRRTGGPVLRWVSSYQYESMRQSLEDPLIILPQIESRNGLANVDEIARHQLTTAVAVGPYDLSANLGVCWEPDSPELQQAIERVQAAARAAGKRMWMVGDSAEFIQRGFNFLCIADPVDLCEQAMAAQASALRAAAAAHSASGERTK